MYLITKEDTELLSDYLLERSDYIKSLQVSKNLYASGRSAEGLHVVIENNVGQIVDETGYFQFQEDGRPPGWVNYRDIYDWLQYRKYGIDWDSDHERISISIAIANKIMKTGSFTYRNKIHTGVISDAVNEFSLQGFISVLSERKSIEIKSDIIEGFKP